MVENCALNGNGSCGVFPSNEADVMSSTVQKQTREPEPETNREASPSWRLFCAGDPRVFEAFYSSYGQPVFRFLLSLTGSQERSQDLSQEVWLRVWNKRGSLRDGASFRPWLFRIAYRTYLTSLRNRRRDPTEAIETDDHADENAVLPAEILIRQEMFAEVRGLIETLPAERRVLLWLTIVEGYSSREAAQILAIPEGTVRSRLHYTLKKLRAGLNQER